MRSLLLLVLLACQAKARELPDPAPAAVEVRDAQGEVVASVRPGRPCRGTVGTTELLVGSSPLVSQVGDVRWHGDVRPNGTMLLRDDREIARVADAAGELGVYDPAGIPIVRIAATGTGATVADHASRVVHRATLQPKAVTIDAPALVVTGTRDAMLAALLSAPEVQPEVRVLAACERLAKGSR